MGETDTREIELTSGEVILHGELFGPDGGVPLVVMCHGIPLSRPDPADPGYAGLARSLGRHGYATLFVNFRGTGLSSGNFCMGGWYEDLGSVMDYTRETLTDNYKGRVGCSLRGGSGWC
jgi:alpha/beta superfamily hydrolase